MVLGRKKIVIFGFGQRGMIYASFAKQYPEKFEIVAIIDVDERKMELAKKEYPNVALFKDYNDFLVKKIPADIVAVATQDEGHKEHAIAMMKAGYDLLLEKPISNSLKDCLAIYKASKKYGRKVIVCHVLRYTPFYSTVKRILDSGKIGEIMTVHASENVGYYHYAHSFVRGPWRNKEESSPMILAKCCHDMDILRYLIGEDCICVNSHGCLTHFKEENAPQGSAKYCSDCLAVNCPYRAQDIYLSEQGDFFANYFTTKEHTRENVLADLEKSDYDRCVYRCDNDVVDHQVTIAKFKNNVTACHTLTAFSKIVYRDLKIHGTKAELYGNVEGNELEIRYFDKPTELVKIDLSQITLGGHKGGDFFMMESLYKVLCGEKAEGISYLDVSIESHLMSFAAEKSRLNNGKTVFIKK